MVGGSRKVSFADVQYCVYTDEVGGWVRKVQNHADVIYEWSLSQIVEGSCGVVTPNTECKIVDVSTGDNLPPHKTGELCVRGKVGTYSLFYFFKPKSFELFIELGQLKLNIVDMRTGDNLPLHKVGILYVYFFFLTKKF